MIKVGIICEGAADKVIFSSEKLRNYLLSIDIDLVDDVVDANGCGNLLPHKIEEYLQRLQIKGAEKIIIIRDKDDYPCFTSVKELLHAREEDVVIVPAKELESWFLADTATMRLLFGDADFYFEHPENEADSFGRINQLLVEYHKKQRNKKLLASKLLELGFDIQESASHPNCPSAKYFIDKLQQIAAN